MPSTYTVASPAACTVPLAVSTGMRVGRIRPVAAWGGHTWRLAPVSTTRTLPLPPGCRPQLTASARLLARSLRQRRLCAFVRLATRSPTPHAAGPTARRALSGAASPRPVGTHVRRTRSMPWDGAGAACDGRPPATLLAAAYLSWRRPSPASVQACPSGCGSPHRLPCRAHWACHSVGTRSSGGRAHRRPSTQGRRRHLPCVRD